MPEPDATPRIVAVVVTYNRAPLVQRLLANLARGTLVPDEVVVVDNASTDGTSEAIRRGDFGLPVHLVTQPENTGGAGGFRTGTLTALERGAELIWLMDDDGTPAADCLERLVSHAGKFDFLGPLVVDEQHRDQLVFPIRLPGTSRALSTVAQVRPEDPEGVIAGVVIPFNGVLLSRELVERIGAPRAEFFIWGDDVEYLWRAERAGARIATLHAARFDHPRVGDLGTPTLLGRQTYNHSPSDLKAYCMARNNWVNLRTYRGWAHALAFLAKTVWFYTLTRPDPHRLRLMLAGIAAGVRQDFTGHRRFLA